MNLQAEDKSNKALTVGSLNVLGGMKSDEITSIHTHLQAQDGVQSRIIADMGKLYQSISADGVITANEKQMLKKELTIIETEYPIILAKAEAAKKSKADIDTYKEAFQKLYHYIYRELKVFDSMQTTLEIERTTFNAVFAAYYSSRALLQITQDGSTKFLPSLEITGDYENQIGTFQGRLYRWTGGKWVLLNAVMPLNPVAHYDMADVQYSDISLLEFSNYTLQANTPDGYGILDILKYCKNGHCYELSADFVATKGNPSHASIYYYDFDAGGQWGNSITEHNTPVVDGKCRAFIRFIKQEIPNHNIKMLFYPGKAGDTQGVEAYYKSFSLKHLDQIAIDASGNNNHATIIGDVEKIKDGKIGTALDFNKGCVAHQLYTTIFQHGYLESTGKYDAKILCNLSAYKGKTIQVTVSGYRKGEGGHPRLYIYDTNWDWGWNTSSQLDSTSEVTFKTTLTIPTAYNTIWCTLYHIPGNKMNNTIVMTHCTIELVENKSISCIGVGKQWTHSRWIKMNGDAQDKTVNPRLWHYGAIDYCYTDIAANSGVMQCIYIVTYKTNSEVIGIAIPKVNIADDKWHNLIVCNDVQSTYARKIVYLDGKLIEDTTVNGDFTGLINDQNVDMSAGNDYVKGSLANLLFFDRLLTEQEILYLYLNPQYPVKNYTLADWAIDPANPDSSIKNLTPKYLGVTETVPTTRTVLITKGERLGAQDANAGDWVLMAKTVGGWKCGVCYRWTGCMWINLEPEYNYTEQYQAALYHICEIPELMQNTGHFGALFAKALVAQKALIDNLVAKNLLVDSDINNLNDFETKINKTDGVLVRNKNKTILEVSPTGKSVFTGEVNVGAIQLIDSGIFLKDGEISIENAGWKGVLKPCKNGVELCIMGGDGGRMEKKQLYTSIVGGIMSLFVLGNITSCGHGFKGGTALTKPASTNSGGVRKSWFGVACNGNTWVAVGMDGALTVSTDNGATWTPKPSGVNELLYGVACNGNTWVAIGSRYAPLVSTDNGATWNKKGTGKLLYGIACNGNTWISCFNKGCLLVSTDNGVTWKEKLNGTNELLRSIACNGNTWIASVMVNNNLAVSTDNGATWTPKSSGVSATLNRVACNDDTWVAVGVDGVLTVSTDNGATWTPKPSGVNTTLNSVVCNDDTWVAVGVDGVLIVSTDNGATWTPKSSGTNAILYDIACNGNTWVVAGGEHIFVFQDSTIW